MNLQDIYLNTDSDGGALSKGVLTKQLILDAALEIAAKSGLEGLTIGDLADAVSMSKSGVFAQFGSKEGLQIAVIKEYYRRFEHTVFLPAMKKKKGLPRLLQMMNLWIDISVSQSSSGCFFIAGAIEYDDRAGPVRDELVRSVQIWRHAILRAIRESIDVGDLKKTTNPNSLLFLLYSSILGVHHDWRFLKEKKSHLTAKDFVKSILNQYANTRK